MGGVVHIINHAKNKTLLFDASFTALVESIADRCPTVERWILMTDIDRMPATAPVGPLFNYEHLLAQASDHYLWPELDENTACTLCYTSGTTGNPKGVLYSHRSSVLHALVACSANSLGLSRTDCVLPVVPMFHVNAWGLPYVAFMLGCKLVMPGGRLDGASLYELIESEKVSFSAGVPTIWLGLLNHVQQNKRRFTSLVRTAVGGSAMPVSLIKAYDELGVNVMHGWGMTELSPRGTSSRLLGDELTLPKEAQYEMVSQQGRAPFSVDMKIVDEAGEPCLGMAWLPASCWCAAIPW